MTEEVVFRSLQSGEEQKLIEAIMRVPFFANDPAIAACNYMEMHVFGEAVWDPSLTKVAVVDDRIVSQVVIQPRVMYAKTGKLKVGGGALVGTTPGYENNGYASKLLEMVLADLGSRGYDASMFFTKNPYFYRRPGCGPVPREFNICGLTPYRSASFGRHSFWRFRRGRSTLVSDISQLYLEQSRGVPFLLERDDWYWRNRMPNRFMFPEDFWVFTDSSGLVGYALLEQIADCVLIKEAGWRSADVLDEIIRDASEFARINGMEKIGMFGPALRGYSPTYTTLWKDGIYVQEDLMMVSLREDLPIPEGPVQFWPTDHF